MWRLSSFTCNTHRTPRCIRQMRKIVNSCFFRFGSRLVLERFSNGIFLTLLLSCAELMIPLSFDDCPTEPSKNLLLGSKPRNAKLGTECLQSLQGVLLVVLMTIVDE